ncbi:Fe-Mn family superoxide dismutase [Azospirillum sp. sgz301742]
MSERDGRLRNVWAADHAHTLADGRVVLALDMYEHAYHLDFGAKAGAYVDAFMANIAWERVAGRHRRAAEGLRPASRPAGAEVPEMSVVEARRMIESGEILVLDVCWDEDWAKSPDILPTAVHHDARRIAEWADGVPKDREVLAYCAYGFQVSRDAVAELRRRGVSARTLAGGISAWRAMGAPTVPKP